MTRFLRLQKLTARFSLILLTTLIVGANSLYAGDLQVSWIPPTTNEDGSQINDLAGYKVYAGITTGEYVSVTDVGNVTSHTLTNLVDGLAYYVAVSAYDYTGNEGLLSSELTKTVQYNDTAPPVISGIYTSNVTRTEATINWTTSEGADSQIEFGTTPNYGHFSERDTSLVTAHSVTVTLAPGTLYHYRVYSRDSEGNLAVSEDHTFTTEELPDLTGPSISNIHVNNISANSATVTWSTDEPSTSQVEFGLNMLYGYHSTYNSNLVTIHSVVLSNLESNSTYEFRVKSIDSSYNKTRSDNYSFTTSNITPRITSFTADPKTGETSLVVNYSSSSSDPDGYITTHEWDFDGDGNYDENTGAVENTSFIYTETGTYNARLRVTDNGGSSVKSSVITVTINEPSNQSPVISSFTGSKTSGTIPLTVTFSAVASDPDGEITEYLWDFDGNGVFDAKTSSNSSSYTFNSTGTYEVKVKVLDNDGNTAIKETIIEATKNTYEERKRRWRRFFSRWRR